MLARDPQAVLIRLRGLCLALPETDEIVSHGIPAFRVASKMFAYFRHNHHGDGTTCVCLKTTGRDAVLTGFFSSSTLWPNLVVTSEMRTEPWLMTTYWIAINTRKMTAPMM